MPYIEELSAFTKNCRHCGLDLPLSSFGPKKQGVFGRYYKCRKCVSASAKEKRGKDPAEANRKLREWRAANGDKTRQQRSRAYRRRAEKCRAAFKKWREDNREYCSLRLLEWRKKNPDRIKAHAKKRSEKLKGDPVFAIKHRVYGRLRRGLYGKRSGRIEEIGCDAECLRKHIELLFPEGMGWHNMQEWAIDHFYPLAAIGSDPDWLSLAAVCNYRNLRPVWKRANSIKRDVVFQDALALFETIKELILAGKA